MSVANRAAELRDLIRQHKERYYVHAARDHRRRVRDDAGLPTERAYPDLADPRRPRSGGGRLPKADEVAHLAPMLSLDNLRRGRAARVHDASVAADVRDEARAWPSSDRRPQYRARTSTAGWSAALHVVTVRRGKMSRRTCMLFARLLAPEKAAGLARGARDLHSAGGVHPHERRARSGRRAGVRKSAQRSRGAIRARPGHVARDAAGRVHISGVAGAAAEPPAQHMPARSSVWRWSCRSSRTGNARASKTSSRSRRTG